MAGVFFAIKNWLKQEYGGRYIALLLSELAEHDPHSFARIIDQAPKKGSYNWQPLCADIRRKKVKIRREFSFDGRDGRRQADLAFLRADGNPAALIEVKEKDDFHSGQLQDYLEQVKRGTPFIHLSRFAPEPPDEQTMEKARTGGRGVASIRYRDAHRVLQKTQHSFSTMVRDYLQEIGVGAYLPIGKSDNRAAAFVLTQLLGFPSNHGLGKLSGRDAVTFFPELIRRMFDNLEFVAEWVHEPNRQLIGMRFTRKLLPRPDFDLTKLAKEVQGATGVDALPGNDGKYVEGGEVLFFAEGKIHNKTEGKIDTKIATEWLYLQIGFGLQISKGPSNTPGSRLVHPYLYTEFYGKNMNSEDTYKETGYLNAFPKEEHALSLFHKCLTKSRENALKNTSGATKAALHEFKVPPAP